MYILIQRNPNAAAISTSFVQLKSMQALIGCENWLPVLFQSVLEVT